MGEHSRPWAVGEQSRPIESECRKVEISMKPDDAAQRIDRGELVGWKAVPQRGRRHPVQRHAVGDAAPMARREEDGYCRGHGIEDRRVAAMLAGGWKNGECAIASRVAPDRTAAVADKIAAIRTSLSHMERELRNVAAQAKIVTARS
jgi:hypothetical protein